MPPLPTQSSVQKGKSIFRSSQYILSYYTISKPGKDQTFRTIHKLLFRVRAPPTPARRSTRQRCLSLWKNENIHSLSSALTLTLTVTPTPNHFNTSNSSDHAHYSAYYVHAILLYTCTVQGKYDVMWLLPNHGQPSPSNVTQEHARDGTVLNVWSLPDFGTV